MLYNMLFNILYNIYNIIYIKILLYIEEKIIQTYYLKLMRL